MPGIPWGTVVRIAVPLGLLLAVLWFRHDAQSWHRMANAERTAHVATITGYRNAQAAAKALEDARIATEKARTERIAANALQSYQSRLDVLSGAYNRLRAQAGSAGSPRGSIAVPGLSDAASGITAQTVADGLSLAERYECSASATQLDELISFVEAAGERPATGD